MKLMIAVGAQWGCEGKGKLSLRLAEDADACMRFDGGGAALDGSIHFEGKDVDLRMLPAGMARGAMGLIGDGVAIRCDRLMKDVEALEAHLGDLSDRLMISGAAHIVMPDHVRRDGGDNDDGETETIREGVGPAVADRARGIGVAVDRYLACEGEPPGFEPWEERADHVALLKKFRGDVKEYLSELRATDKTLLLQGSQGLMLDAIHGAAPAVASTNATTTGMLHGAGLPYSAVTRNIGVCEVFPARFDDGGPLPTETPGDEQDRIREMAAEYLHAPVRALRIGYMDLVALRYSHRINDYTELCLNKIDVMSGLAEIPVCVAYERDGRVHRDFHDWRSLADRPVAPVYETLPGWSEDCRGARRFEDLPENARAYAAFIEKAVGVPIRTIGTGPAEDDVVLR